MINRDIQIDKVRPGNRVKFTYFKSPGISRTCDVSVDKVDKGPNGWYICGWDKRVEGYRTFLSNRVISGFTLVGRMS